MSADTDAGPRLCGYVKDNGQPCGQKLGPNRDRCIWHAEGMTPALRSALASTGGLARLSLPRDTPAPRWRSRTQIVAWLEEQARLVLTGQLDRLLAAEARQHAEVALKAYELSAMEKLDTFERVIAGKSRRIS